LIDGLSISGASRIPSSSEETNSSITSVVPVPELTEVDEIFVEELNSLTDRFTTHLENFAPSKANEEISSILTKMNGIVQDLSPWLYPGKDLPSNETPDSTSKPKPTTLSEAHRAIYLSIETLRIVSTLYSPIMPVKMKQVRETLGFSEEDCGFDRMKLGLGRKDGTMKLRIGGDQIQPLFPRVKVDISISKSSVKGMEGKKKGKRKIGEVKE